MEFVYEIAVDAPLATTLTYSQPAGRVEPLPTGCCVRVPLGNRRAIGYVLGPAPPVDPESSAFVTKPIAEALTSAPVFPPDRKSTRLNSSHT